MSLASEGEIPAAPSGRASTSTRRLWKLVGWVALGHVVLILLLSPRLYCSAGNSPEALMARGEQAMSEGKYAEAMDCFRKVMDQQPKPPPIYLKAAENHRIADRLSRQTASQSANKPDTAPATAPTIATPTATPSTPPTATFTVPSPQPPTPATQPTKPFIPPELQRR